MGDLTLFTCDWVAEPPRGYARDIRLRWARSVAVKWLFAALNSVEMASLPWSLFVFSGYSPETPEWKRFDGFLGSRLKHLEPVLAGREWLAGTFSIGDILMADELRLVDRFERLSEYPACGGYVARATSGPSFVKAHADQMAHFAAADQSGSLSR